MSDTETSRAPAETEVEDLGEVTWLPRGPKGGRTTRTHTGMVRKSLMLRKEEAEALRRRAFETERSEAEIVREAVRRLLGLPVDPAEAVGRSRDRT